MSLTEQVKAIPDTQGYHVHGIIEVVLGPRSEVITRSIDETIQGQDARRLSSAETEQEIAGIIANVYFELDIDEEPPFAIRSLENWQLTIEPYQQAE